MKTRPSSRPATKRPLKASSGWKSDKENRRPLLDQLLSIKAEEKPKNKVSEVLTRESEQQCPELQVITRDTFEDRKRKQLTLDQMNQNEEYEILMNKPFLNMNQVSILSSSIFLSIPY